MSQQSNIPFIVLASVGLAITIASIITSVVTAKNVQPADKDSVLASSALTGFGTIILIVALILMYSYIKSVTKTKGLKVAAFVLFGLHVVMIVIGAIIAGVIGNKAENQNQKGALIASAVLPMFALIFYIIAIVIALRNSGVRYSAPSVLYRRA